MEKISRRDATTALFLTIATAFVLLTMGRPPICTCGYVELWHAAVDSGNSQHIADWYTPSHIVHGFLFYLAGWWLLRGQRAGVRLCAAVLTEALWEIAENTPMVIDRYRTATFALGYSGDSVLNSVADIGFMTLGFLLARRLPTRASIAACVALELAALAAIRDNLTLNVLMLLRPIEAIKSWQGG